ncbi:hypothetical protein BC830DRAFT_1076782 [Chytriomyces sp. MP71]|nr:hypothetical protein BC830DRAFT_1076782 [Chytriomyces sp. MP71]
MPKYEPPCCKEREVDANRHIRCLVCLGVVQLQNITRHQLWCVTNHSADQTPWDQSATSGAIVVPSASTSTPSTQSHAVWPCIPAGNKDDKAPRGSTRNCAVACVYRGCGKQFGSITDFRMHRKEHMRQQVRTSSTRVNSSFIVAEIVGGRPPSPAPSAAVSDVTAQSPLPNDRLGSFPGDKTKIAQASSPIEMEVDENESAEAMTPQTVHEALDMLATAALVVSANTETETLVIDALVTTNDPSTSSEPQLSAKLKGSIPSSSYGDATEFTLLHSLLSDVLLAEGKAMGVDGSPRNSISINLETGPTTTESSQEPDPFAWLEKVLQPPQEPDLVSWFEEASETPEQQDPFAWLDEVASAAPPASQVPDPFAWLDEFMEEQQMIPCGSR